MMGAPAPPNPPLGASWGALKRSRGRLGTFLAALGEVLGASREAPKRLWEPILADIFMVLPWAVKKGMILTIFSLFVSSCFEGL